MIKQFDLTEQYKKLKPEIGEAIQKVLDSGQFCMGKQLEKFEENFAKYIGTKHAIGVNSGSVALTLSLEALGIGPGDEVLVPANTYIATAFAVSHVGATPVFVDNDEYYHMSIMDIVDKITERTKAIIPVHLYGLPMNMETIVKVADDCGLLIVEDCAQATGATFKNQKVGTFGDIGCFSFYPAKNLGAMGDGGMIVTDNDELKRRVEQLRNDGRTAKYVHEYIGHNERLDTLQAAILDVKLKYLDEWNRKRRTIAQLYSTEIERREIPIVKPMEKDDCYHVYHQYVIRLKHRDWVKDLLWHKYGIGTGVHYPIPVHKQEAYEEFNNDSCLQAEQNAEKLLSLPMYPELPLESAIEVIDSLEEIMRGGK